MNLSSRFRLALAAATLALAQSAASVAAERPLGVVELFTSQGCSSCPPADANLAHFAQSPDVVALAYHVDYWDYLGWSDTLASPENTQRQRDYATALGQRTVYTPQAVVNGRAHLNGADRKAIEKELQTSADEAMLVDVSIAHGGDSVVIEAGPHAGYKGKANLVLVFFEQSKAVDITRGENAGKRMVYWNPVTGIQSVGMWHGQAMRVEIPASEMKRRGAGGCAVLLQAFRKDGAPGPIIGAAVLKLPGV
jgi:hypothetical protein